MLGVSMRRVCPDQTAGEMARQASVNAALATPPPSPIKPAVMSSSKLAVDRRQLGFMRGGR